MVGLANPRTANCSIRPVLARSPDMSSSNPEVMMAPGSDASVTRAEVTMLMGDWCSPVLHTTSCDKEKRFVKKFTISYVHTESRLSQESGP